MPLIHTASSKPYIVELKPLVYFEIFGSKTLSLFSEDMEQRDSYRSDFREIFMFGTCAKNLSIWATIGHT